jgi:hypothetical protein
LFIICTDLCLEGLMMTPWVALISYYSIVSLHCIGVFDWHVVSYIFSELCCSVRVLCRSVVM